MNKKPYEAPTVKKIRLEIKNAILAVCNTSTSNVAFDEVDQVPCTLNAGCYDAG